MTAPKTIKRNDPLIGKMYDARKLNTISIDDLIDAIWNIDVIYLSEKHDNENQHIFQENVIQALLDKGVKPAIGFEFFSMNNTPDILNFMDSGKVKHSDSDKKIIEDNLRRKLGWERQSDKMWGYYFSLLDLARENGLEAAGLDLPDSLKSRITRKGLDGLSGLERHQIVESGYSNDIYKSYMFDIFKDVHCGMGHSGMQEKLYNTWIARNDKMAHSIVQMVTENPKRPVIVIIGGGHTEYGLGVIHQVRELNPVITQVNIGLREISVRPSELKEYLFPLELEGFDPVPPSDYIRFFQRATYEDPCERFKKSLEKMKKRKN